MKTPEQLWVEEWKKRPYSLNTKQINELDVLLVKNGLQRIRDKQCGMCLKTSAEQLEHFVNTKQEVTQKQPQEVTQIIKKRGRKKKDAESTRK
jgi:hypothetical protein